MKHQKTIEQEVINFIKRHQLISGAKKVLIGLSGGADSVFAIRFFSKYSKKYKIDISAVHINHNLRGKESNADEIFCKDLCDKLAIEFTSLNVNVTSFAKKEKKSIEEAARILRYKKFEEVCKQTKSDLIITAHNNDDNTETVLLNIVNGSGIDGLAGIPAKRDNIIRPFLCLSKKDIITYLRKEKIKFVVDSSNENIDFNRNYLRKKIIPNLKKNLNPSLDKVILNSSEVLRNQKKIIDFFIEKVFQNIVKIDNGKVSVSLKKLQKYPSEIFGEILKKIFFKYFNLSFNYNQFLKLNDLLESNTGTKINITGKIIAYKERNEIIFTKTVIEKFKPAILKVNDEIKIGNNVLSIKLLKTIPGKFTMNKNSEIISADKISGDFVLRYWKKGDKIQLLGMKGTKKVSDVLTDLKVHSSERKKQLVLLNRNEIVWLIGLQISEKFKITPKTKNAIKLCFS